MLNPGYFACIISFELTQKETAVIILIFSGIIITTSLIILLTHLKQYVVTRTLQKHLVKSSLIVLHILLGLGILTSLMFATYYASNKMSVPLQHSAYCPSKIMDSNATKFMQTAKILSGPWLVISICLASIWLWGLIKKKTSLAVKLHNLNHTQRLIAVFLAILLITMFLNLLLQ